MREGAGFVNNKMEPETRRTPGYPVFIAILQDASLDIENIILFQHAIRVILILALLVFTLQVTKNRFIPVTAALVYAVDFPSIALSNQIMSETLFTGVLFLLIWLAYILSKATRNVFPIAILAGLVGGLTVLIRPISILFFVPLSLYFLLELKRRALPRLLIFSIAYMILPGAWMAHNAAQVGVATISSISGDDMLLYRAAGTLALEKPGPFLPNLFREQKRLSGIADTRLTELYGAQAQALPHAVKAIVFTRISRDIILSHKASYLLLTVRGVLTSMLGGGATTLASILGLSSRAAKYLVLLYTVPCLFLSLIGAWGLFRANRNLFYLIVLTITYFIGISAGAEAYSRFRIPVMPLYAVAIAAGLYYAAKWFKVEKRNADNPVDNPETAGSK
jgi:hypothetical protein